MDGRRAPLTGALVGGYGALIAFLVAECGKHGVVIHLDCKVVAIEQGIAFRCAGGETFTCDKVILTVPLPLLREIGLPQAARERRPRQPTSASAMSSRSCCASHGHGGATGWRISPISFLLSDETIPVWWTQNPIRASRADRRVGGPRTAALTQF